LDDPRGYAKVYVDSSLGAEHLSMHISVIKGGMRAHDLHQHDEEEIYFILEGIAEATIDGEAFIANAGTAIFVTGDKMHAIRNYSDDTIKYQFL